jgi:hypothetical protein
VVARTAAAGMAVSARTRVAEGAVVVVACSVVIGGTFFINVGAVMVVVPGKAFVLGAVVVG